MAKKAQKKGKTAKKAAKPAKKAAKKPVKKVAAKKATPKKAKPAKKTVAKKAASKPTKKKVAAKKSSKKVVAKKAAPKKAVKKPAKKIAPKKKIVAKKPVKKAAPKKAVVKKVVKAAKKIIAKVVKKIVAPAVKEKAVTPIRPVIPVQEIKKAAPVAKKRESYMDLDDDGRRSSSDMPMVVEYKTPSIRRPQGPAPKPHINTDKRTRYSDAELKEFKLLILKKLEEAQKDYELLKSTLSHKDDHGTDDTSPTFKLLEDGSDVLSKEETSHLAGRQEKFIQNLQNALIRIENKTYGICRATGKLISKERLRSVPHATLAIEAKLEQNN